MKKKHIVGMLAGLAFAHAALGDIDYSITDLGVIPGMPTDSSTYTVAYSISSNGDVAGFANDGPGGSEAFFWSAATGMIGIPTPSSLGGGESYANGVNESGEVVGSFQSRPFIWTAATGMQVLHGALNGGTNAINNEGDVVGGVGASAYFWSADGNSDHYLPAPYYNSSGNAINDVGQVAGSDDTAAMLWNTNNTYTILPGTPGDSSYDGALGINNNGWVVGQADTFVNPRAVLWTPGNNPLDLGPGAAYAINDSNAVVGSTGTNATLWTASTGSLNLNSLLDSTGSGWTLTQARGINNLGQITGTGTHNGVERAFLLTPVATVEPTIACATNGYLTSDGPVHSANPIAVVVTHGWEPGGSVATPAWATSMAQQIASTTNANAFTWTWADAFTSLSPQGYENARAETQTEGIELADSLLSEGVKEVHFIGHSLGSWVNAYASQVLIQNGVTVLQDTILDRPEGTGEAQAEAAMFNQTLQGVGWVDNYYGTVESLPTPATGAPLPQLSGTVVYNQALEEDHVGVHDWYANTIATGDEGFQWSVEAGGVANRPINSVPPQIYVSTPPLIGNQTWYGSTNTALSGSNATLRLNVLISPALAETKSAIAGNESVVSPDVAPQSPPTQLWSDVTVPANVAYLSFDMAWSDNSNPDYLTLQFGDNTLFNFTGSFAPDGAIINSGPIPVAEFAGETDQLLLSLYANGGTDTSVTISDLSFFTMAVPEPSALPILAGGFVFLATSRRSHRSRPSTSLLS